MSDEGGDPACWLDSVCDQCGGFIDRDEEHVCRTTRPIPEAEQGPGEQDGGRGD
jgi:hypothetical protein